MLQRQERLLNQTSIPQRRAQVQPGPVTPATESDVENLRDSVVTLNQAVVSLQEADATQDAQLAAIAAEPILDVIPDPDPALAANSASRVATQSAVKAYVDAAVTGLLDYKGGYSCSANPVYPAGQKGDAYIVTSAGRIGGASGKQVDIGDVFVASADNAGGTEAAVGAAWFVLEHNLQGALLSANNLSDVGNAASARANLGIPTLASGTYTPTLTLVANIDACTAYAAQYMRVGDTVTVSGRVDIDPTTTPSQTSLGVSLPIASNFTATEQCAGAGFCPGVASLGCAIFADATNDRAQITYMTTDTASRSMFYTFTYTVKT